jgi:cytoskeleton-associated protein 5
MPSIVDKCFGSNRAGTKAKAIDAALLYIEVENTGEFVVVSCNPYMPVRVYSPTSNGFYAQADVLRGLDAKQPKLVAHSVKCLADIVT